LKTDVKWLPTVSNKQENTGIKLTFCWHLESDWRKEQGSDEYSSGMDPWIL